MTEEHTAHTPAPAQDATAPPALGRRLPLVTYGLAKGGQPKRDEPGTPGLLSQMLALRFAAQDTRVRVLDVDGQGHPDRWLSR
ncbi:hypothetical protein [Streptomyces sp. WM6378]|uniref:hypothetical protein n=1 Tax=Streptomyces sp. WM6378 TaxID=1415557 RepID=UPI0006AE923F|nr:hypothetical protein [Streptomyces sp. WM6378]KOU43249.1 hypothetical protein ADK54_18270 [Streptomyces sp. WM6378]